MAGRHVVFLLRMFVALMFLVIIVFAVELGFVEVCAMCRLDIKF